MNMIEIQAEIDSKLSKAIQETGTGIIHVDGDTEGPGFGYTVGMVSYGLPEVLVTGNLGIEMISSMLNAASKLMRDARSPKIGPIDLEYTYGEDKVPLRTLVRLVTDIETARTQYLTNAVRFYPGKDIDVVQLIWADNANQLPVEPTYSKDPLWAQTVV